MRYIYLMKIIMVLILLGLMASPTFAQSLPEDKSAARILAYFRAGQETSPAANVTLEQFETHLKTLKSKSAPTALLDIIRAWEGNSVLPDKATVITFDGGHRSILTKAFPLLKKYGIPFTVFIASDLANIGAPQYLDWDDIKTLRKSELVTTGMHTASYHSFQDIGTFEKELNTARARFREELGIVPTLFSFPMGEYNSAAVDLVNEQGFIALGQHSGVAYTQNTVLPRFTMNEYYSNETRLSMIINALPLPVTDISPHASISTDPKKALTAFGLTAIHGNEGITCYGSGEGIDVEKISPQRIEIRTSTRMLSKRLRINCTQKIDENNVRWMGFLSVR